jgi:hypothetical protein
MSAAPGLVGQVTSGGQSVRQFPSLSKRNVLRELNRQRRIRRMRRVVIGSADASRESAERGGYRSSAVLVTLTYARNTWDSRHVSDYIKRVREWLAYRGIKCLYQWVIELQQRGVPHYHIIFWLPEKLKLPKPDKSGMWTHGSSNIKRATRPVGYLVKYATKGGIETGELPKGARLFGVGAGGEGSVSHARHRFGLPTWLHDSSEPWQVFRRVTCVGWVCRECGEIRSTPFTVSIDRDPFWGFITLTITSKEI